MSEEKLSDTEKIQTESLIKKVLTTEVKWVIGLIVFIAGVVTPYYDIKTEIALIKQNHLAHIETMQGQIKANSDEIKDLTETQVQLMQVIVENSVRLTNLEK